MIRTLSRPLGHPTDFLNLVVKIRNFRALTEVTGFLIYELKCRPEGAQTFIGGAATLLFCFPPFLPAGLCSLM